MKTLLTLLLAAIIIAPAAIAQPQLPPEPPAPHDAQARRNPGKPPEYFQARRQALAARKQAQIDRMNQVRAARAAADQKAYEDWHERYIADAPVREQYYRALSRAYLADAFYAQERAYYYNYYGPPVVYVPLVPVYYVPHDHVVWPW